MEKEELTRIAFRAGVSEEDVLWVESLLDAEQEMEWPDVLLDQIEE